MKNCTSIFLILLFFASLSYGINEPTRHIIKAFWENKHANTVSINVVPIQGNQAAVYFLEEKLINGLPKQHYKTWISNNVAYDELLDSEKATFLGYFLKLMKERNISDKESTYLDKLTACTKVEDGYMCHSLVEKAWVEKLKATLKD